MLPIKFAVARPPIIRTRAPATDSGRIIFLIIKLIAEPRTILRPRTKPALVLKRLIGAVFPAMFQKQLIHIIFPTALKSQIIQMITILPVNRFMTNAARGQTRAVPARG